MSSPLSQFRAKMQADGQSEAAIRSFETNYQALQDDQDAVVREAAIEPARGLPTLEEIRAAASASPALLESTVVIKLNGGLGTGMGLDRAKSLVEVRDGKSFLDLIALQILHLREAHKTPLRFRLMSSFSTPELAGTERGLVGT